MSSLVVHPNRPGHWSNQNNMRVRTAVVSLARA